MRCAWSAAHGLPRSSCLPTSCWGTCWPASRAASRWWCSLPAAHFWPSTPASLPWGFCTSIEWPPPDLFILTTIAEGRVARCLLPFIPLMHRGGEAAIIQQWLTLARGELSSRLRGDYGGLALVFEE